MASNWAQTCLLSGTDATHAEHIETIKTRMYVGLTADQRFLPGHLGMGLVEGKGTASLEGGRFLACSFVSLTMQYVPQAMIPWAMRCPSLTFELSWRLI